MFFIPTLEFTDLEYELFHRESKKQFVANRLWTLVKLPIIMTEARK
jgi:hypothetical protein